MTTNDATRSRIHGVLLGTAIGDSTGLPMEGLSATRIARLGWTTPLQHRFLFGWGMMSDDTEHTLMTAQALLTSEDPETFRIQFAKKLRWWLLGLPAGAGMATARAAIKLWVGCSPSRSGVFSAGNGGAMRSALIGACISAPSQRQAYVRALVEITHSDPKAFHGAYAIAEMVALSADGMPDNDTIQQRLCEIGPQDTAWQRLVHEMDIALTRGDSLADYWSHFGQEKGVSGYVYQTVPIALYAWQFYQADFEQAITAVIALGGDTDTVAAITGALCGATSGVDSIPNSWTEGFKDWPRSKGYIAQLAQSLTQKHAQRPIDPVHCSLLGIALRNLGFLVIVLMHGFLRYLPGGLKLIQPR